jgi:hypothetical protein
LRHLNDVEQRVTFTLSAIGLHPPCSLGHGFKVCIGYPYSDDESEKEESNAQGSASVDVFPASLLPLAVAMRIVAMVAEILKDEDNLIEVIAPVTVCTPPRVFVR